MGASITLVEPHFLKPFCWLWNFLTNKFFAREGGESGVQLYLNKLFTFATWTGGVWPKWYIIHDRISDTCSGESVGWLVSWHNKDLQKEIRDPKLYSHCFLHYTYIYIYNLLLWGFVTKDICLQLNTGGDEAGNPRLKVHLTKLKAGDMAAHQDEAPAIYCALPSIFVSPHHLQPATLPIQIYLPSLQPLELLSDYPAPRHHSHHRPCQHPYPRKHLARFSPRTCADLPEELIDFARRFKHWRVRLGFTQTHTWYLSFLASPDALEVIVVTDWLTE